MSFTRDITPYQRKTDVKHTRIANLLEIKPKSDCPFFEVHEEGDGYIAICKVQGRALTRHEARLCEEYWEKCPFKRYGDFLKDLFT
ncbi:MAG: hypothetical protein GSR79_01005 [Desulfurococcales archaeon]|nr:hypothetical protein [Desulfurococcales archaeon]